MLIYLVNTCLFPFPQKINKVKRVIRRRLGKEKKICQIHLADMGGNEFETNAILVFLIAGYDPVKYLRMINVADLLGANKECYFLNVEYMLVRFEPLLLTEAMGSC